MKKIFLIATIALLSLTSVCAQTNNTLVVFSESGERFYLILNGLRQNDAASTNVKAVGLNQSTYKAKVIFDQKGIPDADKTLYMAWEGTPANNMEFVCSIKKDKKGKYKWSMVSTATISANSPYASIQPSYPATNTSSTSVTSIGNTTPPVTTINTSTNATPVAMNTNVSTNDNTSNSSTTVTTTTSAAGAGTNGVNMGVNMNGTGISINMNISDPSLNGSSTQTTTTTTSTTTTYTTGNASINTSVPAVLTTTNTVVATPATTSTTTSYSDNSTATTSTNVIATGTCGYEMNASDFASAKKSIASKSFEDSKLTIAKQIIGSNCMNTAQVKEIMDQFSFEQNKLDWAKYAYNRTTDKNNYFKINDAFTFETSIDELNDYISKVR